MVKIFKEESSNEEKENNQSDLYSCDFSSVDSNMSSSFFVNDFDFIYEGKGCFAGIIIVSNSKLKIGSFPGNWNREKEYAIVIEINRFTIRPTTDTYSVLKKYV